MGMMTADMSMSVDGFITGPDDTVEQGLGRGGERLHEWIYGLESWRRAHGLLGGETGKDDEIMAEAFADFGAVVMGRRMFDHGFGPWGNEPPFHVPVFVVTHRGGEPIRKDGGTIFYFVTEGLEAAVNAAREAAAERTVSLAGGASVIQQALRAGLLAQLQVHIVPVLLGAGVRLFDGFGPEPVELSIDRVVASEGVTHIRYRPKN
jgi:dihydrofolate reductase